MQNTLFVRFFHPELGARTGLSTNDTVYDLTGHMGSFGAWLRANTGGIQAAVSDLFAAAERTSADMRYPAVQFANPPALDTPHWLPPLDVQDVWAAGVTYQRSREARQEEAKDGGDVYARVYDSPRPELFFKARAPWVVGPYGQVGIRRDAAWNVPEPELTLVINPAREVVGLTIGNDMSSRDIEGENPLYLPQAKIYTRSCALGPGILLGPVHTWPALDIHITIRRGGAVVVQAQTHTGRITRKLDELVGYLGHSMQFPDGVLLMTGTGIVPASDFTLAVGDEITITIDSIGSLVNTVQMI
jgi:2-dehydro-3-deoxy-D-arabinonate dehydratase